MAEDKSFVGDLAEVIRNASQGDEPMNTETPAEESQPEVAKEEESAPSQEEQKPEEAPVQKEEVPFHKHPRFQRLTKELKELREWKEEQLKQSEEKQEAPKKLAMPQEFVDLFGDNPEAWEKYSKLREIDKLEARSEVQRILDEQSRAQRQEQEAQEKVVAFAEDRFLDLAESTGIDLTDRSNPVRNQILDIVEKYQLYTGDGLPNIDAANDLRLALYPVKNDVVEEKKKVAARASASKSSGNAVESEIMTPSKLRAIERQGGIMQFIK